MDPFLLAKIPAGAYRRYEEEKASCGGLSYH
jgi:hypothetical protein